MFWDSSFRMSLMFSQIIKLLRLNYLLFWLSIVFWVNIFLLPPFLFLCIFQYIFNIMLRMTGHCEELGGNATFLKGNNKKNTVFCFQPVSAIDHHSFRNSGDFLADVSWSPFASVLYSLLFHRIDPQLLVLSARLGEECLRKGFRVLSTQASPWPPQVCCVERYVGTGRASWTQGLCVLHPNHPGQCCLRECGVQLADGTSWASRGVLSPAPSILPFYRITPKEHIDVL